MAVSSWINQKEIEFLLFVLNLLIWAQIFVTFVPFENLFLFLGGGVPISHLFNILISI